MKHRYTALLFAVLVLALAAFTGSAFAGGGNGNGNGSSGSDSHGNSANAPGHQDQSTQAPAPPSTQPQPSKHGDKQSNTSPSNPATGGSNANGVKPSNTTKHDTYATASSDQTKKYGNGKTAGQIATQAGYGDATLHGPGNSQPHKVLCGGHEVDVHALAHKGNKCGSTAPETAPPTKSEVQVSTCTTTTQTITEQVLVGVRHMIGPKGSGRYVFIHPSTNSAHFTKHADDVPVYETVTKTLSVPTGSNCSSTQPTVISTHVESITPPPPAAPTAAAPLTASGTAAKTATRARAAATPAAVKKPARVGAVKGAVITLKPTKAKPAGGVLGVTTRLGHTVAATRLPFTGLPLWIFVIVAATLIAIGAGVRRTASRRI